MDNSTLYYDKYNNHMVWFVCILKNFWLTSTENKAIDLEKENAGLWLTNMIWYNDFNAHYCTCQYDIYYSIQSSVLMHLYVHHSSVAADKGGVIFNYFIDCLVGWEFL